MHDQLPQLNDNYLSIQNINGTVNGREKILHNVYPSKAIGPDEIHAHILKQYATEFSPHLAHAFITFQLWILDWKQTIILHHRVFVTTPTKGLWGTEWTENPWLAKMSLAQPQHIVIRIDGMIYYVDVDVDMYMYYT